MQDVHGWQVILEGKYTTWVCARSIYDAAMSSRV